MRAAWFPGVTLLESVVYDSALKTCIRLIAIIPAWYLMSTLERRCAIRMLPLLLAIVAVFSIWLRYEGITGRFGHSSDFAQAKRQAMSLIDGSFLDLYAHSGGDNADHPVALYWCLKIAATASLVFGIPIETIIKGMYAGAEVATVLLIVSASLRLFGEAAALRAATLYLMVPVFSYVGSLWGHHGCVEVFFTLAAIMYMAQRRHVLAFIAFAVALAFRVHALVILPFLVFVFLSNKIILRTRLLAIGAGIITHTLLILPLLNEVGFDAYRLLYTGHLGRYTGLTYGAFNIWSFKSMAGFAKCLDLGKLCDWVQWCPGALDSATLLGFALFGLAYLISFGLFLRLRSQNFMIAVLLPATFTYLMICPLS